MGSAHSHRKEIEDVSEAFTKPFAAVSNNGESIKLKSCLNSWTNLAATLTLPTSGMKPFINYLKSLLLRQHVTWMIAKNRSGQFIRLNLVVAK